MLAQLELKVALVVGGNVHPGVDRLPRPVVPADDPVAVPAPVLVPPRPRLVPGVAADAAPAAVPLPLPPDAAAKQLVVVVVGRVLEAVAPHAGAGRRLLEPPVAERPRGAHEEEGGPEGRHHGASHAARPPVCLSVWSV